MNVTALKGVLALIVTSTLFVGLAIRYRKRRAIGPALQFLGTACLIAVALAHFFEEWAIFPAVGWGQPRSIGHYIDLGAMTAGVTLVSAGLFFQYGRAMFKSEGNDTHMSLGGLLAAALLVLTVLALALLVA